MFPNRSEFFFWGIETKGNKNIKKNITTRINWALVPAPGNYLLSQAEWGNLEIKAPGTVYQIF